MPRVRFPDIRIRRSESRLKMQLQSLVYDYRTGALAKPEMRTRGEQILRKHYEAATADAAHYLSTQGIQLSVEDREEHKALLAQALEEWGSIVVDAKRM